MPETLRYLHQTIAEGDVSERLIGAAINAGGILEPAQIDPRRAHPAQGPADSAEDIAPAQPFLPAVGMVAAADSCPPPVMAMATAPAAVLARGHDAGGAPLPQATPGDGLRLMPLSGFFWGGRARALGRMRAPTGGAPAAPRVRGDHVLMYLMHGTLGIEFPRQRHLIYQAQLAFIPAGTAFSVQPPRDAQGLVLLIPPHLGRDLSVALPDGFHTGHPDPADLALIGPSLRALGFGSPRTATERAAAACQLSLISVALSRLVDRAEPVDAPIRRIAEARPLTERYLALAASDLSCNLTISELAERLGCTQSQLDRACIESRGRSPLDLLYGLRLDRAAAALRHTNQPTAQIAQELGYTGLGHFIRSFASATGRSPEAFRACAKTLPPISQ